MADFAAQLAGFRTASTAQIKQGIEHSASGSTTQHHSAPAHPVPGTTAGHVLPQHSRPGEDGPSDSIHASITAIEKQPSRGVDGRAGTVQTPVVAPGHSGGGMDFAAQLAGFREASAVQMHRSMETAAAVASNHASIYGERGQAAAALQTVQRGRPAGRRREAAGPRQAMRVVASADASAASFGRSGADDAEPVLGGDDDQQQLLQQLQHEQQHAEQEEQQQQQADGRTEEEKVAALLAEQVAWEREQKIKMLESLSFLDDRRAAVNRAESLMLRKAERRDVQVRAQQCCGCTPPWHHALLIAHQEGQAPRRLTWSPLGLQLHSAAHVVRT